MSVSGAILSALLFALPYGSPASAQEFKIIFNGTVGEQRVVAVSVTGAYSLGDLIDKLRPYATPHTTLVAYINHEAVSQTEPLAVYVDGENILFAERPRFSTESPTFAESMESATVVTRGDRIGAICRDGSRTELTNNGACSFKGGLDRWLYSAVTTTVPVEVVAAICNDYRLVSGEGELCGEDEVLVQIKARPYSQHIETVPQSEEPEVEPTVPTEVPVAPLPEPAIETPVLNSNEVEWTKRGNGQVEFVWEVSVANPNAERVRAVVSVHLRDAAGEIIHSDQRVIALAAGEEGSFFDEGTVDEDIAVQADRWTFDVALVTEDPPLDEEQAASVMLVIDPLVEEARITNTGETELDLHGWTLSSSVGGENFTFRFFKLGPGKTVTLTSGEGARSRLPEVYLWRSNDVWADDGDVAELHDAQGRLRARTNPDGSAAALGGGAGTRSGSSHRLQR